MINKLAEEVREAEETDEDDVIVKVWLSTKYPLQFKPTYVPSTVNWTDEDGLLCHYFSTWTTLYIFMEARKRWKQEPESHSGGPSCHPRSNRSGEPAGHVSSGRYPIRRIQSKQESTFSKLLTQT